MTPIKSLEKGYRFREGDIVALRATVKYDRAAGDEYIHFTIEGEYATRSLTEEAIVGLIQQRFDIDDHVIADGDKEQAGIIRAICGNRAWVEFAVADGGETFGTYPLAELERDVDFEEVPPAVRPPPIIEPAPEAAEPAEPAPVGPSDSEIQF